MTSEAMGEWTFFSNYAHVLVCLAENPQARLRDVADRVGITERTAVRLITQLDEADILKRVKDGRRNSYVIDTSRNLRHPPRIALHGRCVARNDTRSCKDSITARTICQLQ